jgi:hypothetical protein
VVNCCSDTLPEINQRKQGEAGEVSDFSLSRLVFGPELPLPEFRARQCQPHMPGPGQTRCAYSSGAFLAPAAVAEVVGTVSASGAPLRRSGTTAFRLRFTVTTHGPFRPFMKSARCPGRMLRIVGTHPVEARSFVKIALRRAGCGRSCFRRHRMVRLA